MDAFDFSGFQDDSIALLSPKVIQFMNSADLLLYNPGLLDKLGFPAPSWRTFDEQLDYLDAVITETGKHMDFVIQIGRASCRERVCNDV